jgi:hypothetical protein
MSVRFPFRRLGREATFGIDAVSTAQEPKERCHALDGS